MYSKLYHYNSAKNGKISDSQEYNRCHEKLDSILSKLKEDGQFCEIAVPLGADDPIAYCYIYHPDKACNGTKPLVCLHGYGTFFGNQAELLSTIANKTKRKLIGIDWPGMGFSSAPPPQGFSLSDMADWLKKIIDNLNLYSVDIFAYSLGARVLMEFLSQYQSIVGKAILVSAGGIFTPEEYYDDKHNYLEFIKNRTLIFTKIFGGNENDVKDYSSNYPEETLQFVPVHLRNTMKKVFMAKQKEPGDLVEILNSINDRALVIYGDQDKLVSPLSWKAFADAVETSSINHLDFLLLKEAGHDGFFRKKYREIVVRKITCFLTN